MKNVFLLYILFSTASLYAQTSFEVIPKPEKDFKIKLIPFGVDHSIVVGELSQTGASSLTSKLDISEVPESIRDDYYTKISDALGFCDEMNPVISEKEDIKAIEPGPYFLYDKGEASTGTPQGFLILVSDTALFHWVANPDNAIPVLGSYYDIIYVSENFDYKGHCTEKFDDDEVVSHTEYHLDLHLKKGWNFIAYEIVKIHPVVDDVPAFPEKVKVTSVQKLPEDVKWMGYYY